MRREVYRKTTRFHRMTVTEDGNVRVLRFERNPQSSMFLDDPYEGDIEYPDYFHTALAVKPDAARVLAIGLGGGTMVKRMWRDYPWMEFDAVELDPEVVAIARRFFELPRDDRLRVHIGDGRRFLEKSHGPWDLVVVDAYDDYEIPRRLVTEEFMRAARERLAPDGVLTYNVIGRVRGDKSKYFRSLYRTATNVFSQVWAFVVPTRAEIVLTEDRNIVMLLTDAAISEEEFLSRLADRVGGRVTVTGFAGFGRDLWGEPIRGGDVPFLLDEVPRKHRWRR